MADLDTILSGQAPVQEVEKVEPETEVTADNTNSSSAHSAEGEKPEGQRMVPQEALHAEKQKVKRYTEQVASFEKTLIDRDAAWERRFNQLLETVKPPQQAPDLFADPDGFFSQKLSTAIGPVQQTVSSLHNEIAQLKAERVFGEKYGDFVSLVKDGLSRGDPEFKMLSAMMDASPNPYQTAKEWFDKRTFDPAAERERIKAELLAEIKPESQQAMPSNFATTRNVGSRAGPAWAGPAPLEDIFARRK